MPRDQLKKEVAAGKNPLNENNTFWLDSSGKKANFIRDSYSTLHVTDIASGITVPEGGRRYDCRSTARRLPYIPPNK